MERTAYAVHSTQYAGRSFKNTKEIYLVKPFSVFSLILGKSPNPSLWSARHCTVYGSHSLSPDSLAPFCPTPCAYSTCQISSSPRTFKHTDSAMPMTGSLSYFRPSSNITSEGTPHLLLAPAFTGPHVIWFISSRLLTSPAFITCICQPVHCPLCPSERKPQEGKDLICLFTTTSPGCSTW